VIVGVNKFMQEEEPPPSGLLQIGEAVERRQRERLANMKQTRDSRKVGQALAELKRVAQGSENTMPPLLDAVRAYATVGEICSVFREVFGSYTESNIL
jgi:methylmalonyl-CoA mutase N-terminal domain/subunit